MGDVIGKLREKFYEKIIKFEERSPRRVYIEFNPQDIPDIADFLFNDMRCRFVTATGTDTPQGIEMLYHFSYDKKGQVISLRTLLTNKKDPHIKSIVSIITGAEWIEREIWELLGVVFDGHPNLKHLLLIDDWPEGKHPLRHDRD